MKNKVLLITNYGADYQEYFILRGLVDLLGYENVVVYPFKNTFIGGTDSYPERFIANDKGAFHYLGPRGAWSELWADPSLWHIWEKADPSIPRACDGAPGFYQPIKSLTKWDFSLILHGIKEGIFPFVILSSPRWFNSACAHELQVKAGKSFPLVLIDGEDYYQVRHDYINRLGINHYFKRTFFEGYTDIDNSNIKHKVNFYPCPFSSIWEYDWVPWEERKYDVFCVFGATQVLRPKIIEMVKEVCAEFPELKSMIALGHPLPHDEYIDAIRNSRIVVDHQRLGTDTVRTFEVLSSGAAMVGDICIKMPNPYINGQHFFQFENDMSPEGDKQKMDIFKHTLLQAVHGLKSGLTEKVAWNGWAHTRKYHMAHQRAKYVLEALKNNGVDTGDLLEPQGKRI